MLDERMVGHLDQYFHEIDIPNGSFKVDQSIPSSIPFLIISLIALALRFV